jgi:hypothetical protein
MARAKKKSASSPVEQRQLRLAAALRANLRKRKAGRMELDQPKRPRVGRENGQ